MHNVLIEVEYDGNYNKEQRCKCDCLLFDLDDALYPVTCGIGVNATRNIQVLSRMSLRSPPRLTILLHDREAVWLCIDEVGTSERIKGVDHALESLHNMKETLPALWEEVVKDEDVRNSSKVGIDNLPSLNSHECTR
ncbi:hypothetical protein ABZP36_018966 [Zizania latifolia]